MLPFQKNNDALSPVFVVDLGNTRVQTKLQGSSIVAGQKKTPQKLQPLYRAPLVEEDKSADPVAPE